MHILILNGPNLNLIGTRQPEIYGKESLNEYLALLSAKYPDIEFTIFQSNHEGDLIDLLQETGQEANGIILNAGALTHSSLALADAVLSIDTPVVEVHISNIYAREAFRRKSLTASNCKGVITGLGLQGYELALIHLMNAEEA